MKNKGTWVFYLLIVGVIVFFTFKHLDNITQSFQRLLLNTFSLPEEPTKKVVAFIFFELYVLALGSIGSIFELYDSPARMIEKYGWIKFIIGLTIMTGLIIATIYLVAAIVVGYLIFASISDGDSEGSYSNSGNSSGYYNENDGVVFNREMERQRLEREAQAERRAGNYAKAQRYQDDANSKRNW